MILGESYDCAGFFNGQEEYPDVSAAIYDGDVQSFGENRTIMSINNSYDTTAVGFFGDLDNDDTWEGDVDPLYWHKAPSWSEHALKAWNPATHSYINLKGFCRQINDRCEIIGEFYDSEGEYLTSLLRNDQIVDLDGAVSEVSDLDLFYIASINNRGMISARAYDSGSPVSVLLLPFEIDYLTRDSVTGEYSNLGGSLTESAPMPEVDVEVQNAQINSNGDLEVRIHIVVRDPLSEITSKNQLDQLTIYVDEEAYETVNSLSSHAQGDTVPVWRPYKSRVSLDRTITIPNPSPGVVNIRVQTAANGAGNVGWGGVAVTLALHQTSASSLVSSRSMSFTLNGIPSDQHVDQVGLQVDGLSSSILSESPNAKASNVFTGNVATTNGLMAATLWFENTPISDQEINELQGTLELASQSGDPEFFMCKWRETGINTRTFAASAFYTWNEDARSRLYISSTTSLSNSPEGILQPFVVRVTVPESIVSTLKDPQGWLKLKLFDNGVDLVEKTDFIPNDKPPAGSKYLYIASDNQPKLFAILKEYTDTLVPEAAFDEECFRVELITTQDGKVAFKGSPSIDFESALLDQQSEQSMPFRDASIVSNVASYNNSATAGYTKDQVLQWFKFLFGAYGERLLTAYDGMGGTVEVSGLNHLTNWHGYKVKNWYQADQNAGKSPIIIIDNQQKTVIHAAKALFFALNDFRSPWARYDFNNAVFDQALQESLTGDASIDDVIREFNRGQIGSMGEALGHCVTAAEIGLSLVAEPVNWVFTLNDVADHVRVGEYRQAGVLLGAGVILSGPVMKVAQRSGKTIVIHSIEGTLEISSKLRNVLINITEKVPRYKIMRELAPLIKSGELSQEAIEFIYKNSKLLTESRAGLERNLIAAGKPRPKGHAPHHMFPVIPNELAEPMELKFLKAGLDPNDAQFGKWLPKNIHDKIHGVGSAGQGWGPGGAWNYQWKQFFERNANPTEGQIRTFLDKLRGVLDDVIDNSSKPLKEYKWPYKP